jgi:hypothetical protein
VSGTPRSDSRAIVRLRAVGIPSVHGGEEVKSEVIETNKRSCENWVNIIPRLRQISPLVCFADGFIAKHEAVEVVEPYSQACLDGDREQSNLDWTFSAVAAPSRSASLFRSQFCSYI